MIILYINNMININISKYYVYLNVTQATANNKFITFPTYYFLIQ